MRNQLLLIITMACALCAGAKTISVSPGTLSQSLPDAATVTELAVQGSVDASDLMFIAESMPALQTLDLSGTEIAAYSGERVFGRRNHTAATVPAYTFAGSKIKNVVLPLQAGLKIEEGAFAGSALVSVTVPANVAQVADAAFAGCPALRSARVDAVNLGAGVFAACTALESVTLAQGTAVLPDDALRGCRSLRSVNGTSALTRIGNRAVSGCERLAAFGFGPSLRGIGTEAFYGSGLQSVNLSASQSLDSVGEMAFAQMPSLAEIDLGNAAAVGKGAVMGCTALSSISLPRNIKRMPDYLAAGNESLSDIYGIDQLKAIGRYALSGVASVSKIELPASLDSICTGAMERMTALAYITVNTPTPPALGSDVWDGVEQQSVRLTVPHGSYDLYKNAPQWSGFNVVDVMMSADQITDNDNTLHAAFDGNVLSVWTDGDLNIENLGIFAPSGVILSSLAPRSPRVCIDTAPLQGNIFIVAATLSDGSVKTVKTAKK